MVEATTQTSEPTTRNHPMPPLKMFQRIFCNHCLDKEHCQTVNKQMQNCILCLIADELARNRQLHQQRGQHLSW